MVKSIALYIEIDRYMLNIVSQLHIYQFNKYYGLNSGYFTIWKFAYYNKQFNRFETILFSVPVAMITVLKTV